MQIPNEMLLKEVYGETEKSSQRFEKLAEIMKSVFRAARWNFSLRREEQRLWETIQTITEEKS